MEVIANYIPIPLFSTPVESNNPVLITLVKRSIPIEIGIVDEGGVVIDINTSIDSYVDNLIGYLKRFLKTIVDNVLEDSGLYVRINSFYPYALGLYIVVTSKVLEALGLSSNDLIEVSRSIDKYIGMECVIVNGLRRAFLEKTCMVYRDGEEPIKLDHYIPVNIRDHVEVVEEVSVLLKEPSIRSSIIHLSGYSVLEVVKCLLSQGFSKCSSLFYNAIRVFNALYYIAYGVKPVMYGVYVRDLGSYLSIACIGEECIG